MDYFFACHRYVSGGVDEDMMTRWSSYMVDEMCWCNGYEVVRKYYTCSLSHFQDLVSPENILYNETVYSLFEEKKINIFPGPLKRIPI